MTEEWGTRILISDEEWPKMLAQSYHVAVEALMEAGAKFTEIYSSQPERVIDEGEEHTTGWSIDVTSDIKGDG